jgi:hypothetical protein
LLIHNRIIILCIILVYNNRRKCQFFFFISYSLYYFFFLYKLLHLIRSEYKNIQNYITYKYTLYKYDYCTNNKKFIFKNPYYCNHLRLILEKKNYACKKQLIKIIYVNIYIYYIIKQIFLVYLKKTKKFICLDLNLKFYEEKKVF